MPTAMRTGIDAGGILVLMQGFAWMLIIAVLAAGGYLWMEQQKDVVGPASPDVVRTRYVCAEGLSFTVYMKGEKTVVELTEGRKKVYTLSPVLPVVPGVGERYVSDDEMVLFWKKTGGAIIQEDGVTTYAGCAPR